MLIKWLPSFQPYKYLEFKPIFFFVLFCFGHWQSDPHSTLIGELGSHVWEGLLFDWLELAQVGMMQSILRMKWISQDSGTLLPGRRKEEDVGTQTRRLCAYQEVEIRPGLLCCPSLPCPKCPVPFPQNFAPPISFSFYFLFLAKAPHWALAGLLNLLLGLAPQCL